MPKAEALSIGAIDLVLLRILPIDVEDCASLLCSTMMSSDEEGGILTGTHLHSLTLTTTRVEENIVPRVNCRGSEEKVNCVDL